MVDSNLDIVARYGASNKWQLKPRTIIVEGTSDVSLFELAADLFFQQEKKALLGDLAIVAAGEGDRGGTHGVVRELVVLRGLSTAHLSKDGRQIYRIVGLFDNDAAGQKAVNGARSIDSSIVEYRDIFRLRPIMPAKGSLDPSALARSFETENIDFKGLSWELEDMVSEPLVELFLEEHPTALLRKQQISGRTHRELTRDGKAKLIRFCRAEADLEALTGVVDAIHAMRHYMNLPSLS